MIVTNNGFTRHCFKLDTLCNDKQTVRDGLRVGLPLGVLS